MMAVLWLWALLLRKLLKERFILLTSKWLKPVPLQISSTNTTADISVVVATIDGGETLTRALLTWLATEPLEIIIVTIQENLAVVRDKVSSTVASLKVNATSVVVLSIPQASKRQQTSRGIQHALGSIIILTDDDVFWPRKILHLIMTCFDDPRVGGVGTNHRGDFSLEKGPSVWAYLADRRLKRRNVMGAMSSYCDASVTCLSGRTAAYRGHILKDPSFLHQFTHDRWLGNFLLDSGDDTFITRWLLCAGWNIKMQTDPRAEIRTISLNSRLFLRQLLRWSRNSKRSFLRCIFMLPNLWRSNAVLMMIMVDELLSPFLFMLQVWFFAASIIDWEYNRDRHYFSSYLIGNLLYICYEIYSFQLPYRYLVASWLFDFILVPLDLYSFMTLTVTAWGSRIIKRQV